MLEMYWFPFDIEINHQHQQVEHVTFMRRCVKKFPFVSIQVCRIARIILCSVCLVFGVVISIYQKGYNIFESLTKVL